MDLGEIPSIRALVVLDAEGKRIVSRYYKNDFSSLVEEHAFEKKLFEKTMRTNAKNEAEIIMFDNVITVFKFVSDLHFYVTGSQDENELILVTVLQALFDAISLLLR